VGPTHQVPALLHACPWSSVTWVHSVICSCHALWLTRETFPSDRSSPKLRLECSTDSRALDQGDPSSNSTTNSCFLDRRGVLSEYINRRAPCFDPPSKIKVAERGRDGSNCRHCHPPRLSPGQPRKLVGVIGAMSKEALVGGYIGEITAGGHNFSPIFTGTS
jgi:hypothetical protein